MGQKRIGYGQHLLCRAASCIILLMGFGSLAGSANAQQTEFAGILEILYGQVEIQRTGTTQWIPLVPGAVSPVGTGDELRTGDQGRAVVGFPGLDASFYVLPSTHFRFDTLNDSSNPIFRGTLLRGEIIQQVQQNQFTDYTIHTETQLTQLVPYENNQVLIRFQPDASVTTYVLVASGRVTIEHPFGEPITLLRSQAGLIGDTPTRQAQRSIVSSSFTPAQIEGEFAGCKGMVITSGEERLNARAGPSTSNPLFGSLLNGADIQVMGITESRGWYRVQYRSGYGWVERLAVQFEDTDCTVPTLPDTSYDIPNRILNVTDTELIYLIPFYGRPGDDPIFYQRDDISEDTQP